METSYEKKVFRFDIDTHKCIRKCVPNLLGLSDKYNVPFSFFLNMGKSISLKESIKSMVSKNNKERNEVQMMGAIQKLGFIEYVYIALINPNVSYYKNRYLIY